MNMKIIKVVGLIAGGVGVCIGGVFGVKAFRKRSKARREANIEVIRDEGAKSPQKFINMKVGDAWTLNNVNKAEKATFDKIADGYKNYEKNAPKDENFEEYMAAMEAPEEDEDDEEEEDDSDSPFEGLEEDGIQALLPRIIDIDDFTNTRLGYDKVSLNYFTQDKVLCDDRGNVISGDVININFIFDEDPAKLRDGLVVYIRNDKIESDYEVTIIHSSYKKDVLGKE